MRYFRSLLSFFFLLSILSSTVHTQNDSDIRLIIRGDDFGMTQGSLEAIEKSFNNGSLSCSGIQTCAPWFEAAAEMCAKNPGWCIGVHLTIVGEWQGYRWRPVLPWDKVSSIVDEDGYLYTSPDELNAHNPKIEEVEDELRAQIDLALKRGIEVSYIDNHYGAVSKIPGGRELMERLGRDYNVPVSGFNGEKNMSISKVKLGTKIAHTVELLSGLEPGLYCWVCHPGIDSPEHEVLIHTNPVSIYTDGTVGKHRAEITEVVTSIELKSIIMKRGIKLTNYREMHDELTGQ